MLLRQTLGGRLSNFDLHLTRTFVSGGFVVALSAILPPLFTCRASPRHIVGDSKRPSGAFSRAFPVERHQDASPCFQCRHANDGRDRLICIATGILSLVANAAVVPTVQGALLFSAALTSCLAVLMGPSSAGSGRSLATNRSRIGIRNEADVPNVLAIEKLAVAKGCTTERLPPPPRLTESSPPRAARTPDC